MDLFILSNSAWILLPGGRHAAKASVTTTANITCCVFALPWARLVLSGAVLLSLTHTLTLSPFHLLQSASQVYSKTRLPKSRLNHTLSWSWENTCGSRHSLYGLVRNETEGTMEKVEWKFLNMLFFSPFLSFSFRCHKAKGNCGIPQWSRAGTMFCASQWGFVVGASTTHSVDLSFTFPALS